MSSTTLQHLSDQAATFHQKGDLAQAERAYRQIIAAEPASAGAHHMLGVVQAQQGRVDEALQSIGAALQMNSGDASAWINYGNILRVTGRNDEALMSYGNALAIRPGDAAALRGRAWILLALNRLDDAAADYENILGRDPRDIDALNGLAGIALAQGRFEQAMEGSTRVLALAPGDIEALNTRGNVFRAQQKPAEALAAYDKALALRPDLAETLTNRGGALSEMGRDEEALASYDRALALQPGMAAALNDRGFALRNLMRFDEALDSFAQALAAAPHYAAALANRGKTLSEMNRLDEAFGDFMRSAEISYGAQAAKPDALAHMIQHDREQHEWLKAHGEAIPEKGLRVTGGGRLAGPAIDPANATGELVAQWRTQTPQIAVIDNLLTPEALAGLRRFCRGSDIWHTAYPGGYIGAFPESGFAAPLLAQIAEELSHTFPEIFAAHPLRYHWAFKYDSQMTGIAIHADEAAVNVNFWITPDEANRDPQSGGLVIWDKAAPLDWDFAKFNADESAAHAFLERSGAKSITVPYRANRAVIFDSNLYHATDRIVFAPGYENRRINVTLLYGRRQAGG